MSVIHLYLLNRKRRVRVRVIFGLMVRVRVRVLFRLTVRVRVGVLFGFMVRVRVIFRLMVRV